MSTNAEVASVFRGIADLLDLQGEKFKPEAYRRAARSIEGLGEDLRAIATRGELDQIPGIGDALREKILEFLKDGRVPYYERLRSEFPPGVLELMQVPGIGPKTTGRFYVELHVASPSDLLAAIDAGRLNGLAGFGERKIAALRLALVQSKDRGVARTPLRAAWELARSIVRELSSRTPVETIDVAGSLRRRRETVGDLDILATSADPPATIAVFVALEGVQEVVLNGDTKATVRHAPGIQVDLRVVEPVSFGAALQYFTGSKDHNVRLRTLARDRGLKINEYGVFREEERIAGRTEEEVYESLGMPWIPPELRENQGEIEAALEGKVPHLVEFKDLRGELHRHVSADTSVRRLAEWRREAQSLGFAYLGFVVQAHSLSALPPDLLAAVRQLPADETSPGPRVLLGLEVPFASLAPTMALPAGVDYIIGVPDGSNAAPPSTTLSSSTLFLAHPALGPLEGDTAGTPLAGWLDWSVKAGLPFEVTPDGSNDGLDSRAVRRLVSSGGTIVIGGGGPEGVGLGGLELAVGIARRGGAPPTAVLNARAAILSARRPARGRGRSGIRKD